jgi:hypothetical protein
MHDFFLPAVITESFSLKVTTMSLWTRCLHFVLPAMHLLIFFSKMYNYLNVENATLGSPIIYFFGLEMVLFQLLILPSKKIIAIRPDGQLTVTKIGICFLFASGALIVTYIFCILMYGNALCYLESSIPPPYSLQLLPKAKVWALLRKPLEQNDIFLSLFLSLISSCRTIWWISRILLPLQVLTVCIILVLQIARFGEQANPTQVIVTRVLLHGCRVSEPYSFWQALRLALYNILPGFGMMLARGQKTDLDRNTLLMGVGLSDGKEHYRSFALIPSDVEVFKSSEGSTEDKKKLD